MNTLKLILISVVILIISGCTAYTPSTMLINENNKTYRCSAWGTGFAGTMTAKGIHDTCVRDARLVGYVEIPMVVMGISTEKGTVRLNKVDKGSAADLAGLLKGDLIKKVEEQDVTSTFHFFKALQGKKAGSVVSVEIERGEKLIIFLVTLTERKV